MSDSSLDRIKAGQGIPPLNNPNNDTNNAGTTTEIRTGNGLIYETFEDHSKKK